MKAMTTKLSCEKLAQVISIKKVKEDWCVELRYTCVELRYAKKLLDVEHNTFVFRYKNYDEALDRYVSLVEEQARHIAIMSL